MEKDLRMNRPVLSPTLSTWGRIGFQKITPREQLAKETVTIVALELNKWKIEKSPIPICTYTNRTRAPRKLSTPDSDQLDSA